ARSLCPALRSSLAPIAVIEPDAMDIDVAALHQMYVQGLRSRGGQILRATPVIGLDRVGSQWNVATPAEAFAATYVIDAAGAWCDEVALLAGVAPIGLLPLRRTAFTCPAPDGIDVRAWPLV